MTVKAAESRQTSSARKMIFLAALLITVLGVFYFGIFSDQVIRKFSQQVNVQASLK